MDSRIRLSALGACLVVAAASCSDVPISSLEKSFSVQVDQKSDEETVKIDFLWVIDNSASMCEEQSSLAENFEVFTEKFSKRFQLDQRVAVVGMDMQCDYQVRDNVGASRGKFSSTPASGFPPSCQVKEIKACTTDDDCANLDCTASAVANENCDPATQGVWSCRKARSAKCVTNPNGSINTECKRRCTTDEECQDLFGDARYICQKPSGNQADWGCMLPPLVTGCPTKVGPVLGNEDLAFFPCLATIGVNQNKCFKYEQGLASALAALDPEGENAAELNCTAEDEAAGKCRRFLREDAYLVIIFLSDEEDCSSATEIDEDDHETCGLLADTTNGGPLVPVSHYVNSFKSKKSDPSQVIVAAIAGNSIVGEAFPEPPDAPCAGAYAEGETAAAACLERTFTKAEATIYGCLGADGQPDEGACMQACADEADVEAQQACYDISKSSPFVCFQTSYVCQSKGGRADLGRRYLELARSFGKVGIFENICSDEGIEPALNSIADIIIRTVSKMCLPIPPDGKAEDIEVCKTQVVDDKLVVDAAGEPVRICGIPFTLANDGGETCRGEDGKVHPALLFDEDPPKLGETVFVTYKGKAVK